MSDFIFEIIDKTGRKIHLTKERWSHIRKKHQEIENLEIIEQTIKNPDKTLPYEFDKDIYYYYKYFKDRELPKRYLLVIIKYLNGDGFVLTAYFEKNIR